MTGQPELQRSEALVLEVEPVVRGILRRKLRVTLDPADGRRENQNALELYGDVWVKVLQGAGSDNVRSFRSYAAVVAYHACSEYIRDKYPARASLRNRLHYFLTHHPEYAVWEHEDELICGFVSWRDRKAAPVHADTLHDPAVWQGAKQVERMTPRDWASLFDSLFRAVAGPAPLDDLVQAIAPLVGSVDAIEIEKKDPGEEGQRDVLAETPDSGPSAEDTLRIRLLLQRLWIEILQLKPRQRFAYLLNPTDGEIDVFPANGIATIVEIGRSLAISSGQFDRISKELPPELAGSYEEKFAMLWNRLPLSDKLIALLLAATPQQVINLRKVARERLGRQMKNFR